MSDQHPTPPRTHDYRKSTRGYGHDLSIRPLDGGQRLRATGWGNGLKPEDFVLLSNGDTDTRYAVGHDLSYYPDPPDMWRATLYFAPRTAVSR